MNNNLPVAYIVSSPNEISIRLINELLFKGCQVIVLTNQKNEFKKVFPKNVNLFFNDFKEKTNGFPSYVFLIQGFGADPFFSNSEIKTVFDFVETYSPKTQVILPYVVDNNRGAVENISNEAKKISNENLYILYIGELYSSFFTRLFARTNGNQIGIPTFDFDIYIADVDEAIKVLTKGIFSYGFHKKEIVVTTKITIFNFLTKLQQYLAGFTYIADSSFPQPSSIPNFDFLEIPLSSKNIEFAINDGFKRINNVKKIKLPQIKIAPVSKPKQRKKIVVKINFKPMFFLLVIFFWIVSIPFVTLFISSLVLKTAFYDLSQFNFKDANFYFNISSKLSNFSAGTFLVFNDGIRTSLLIKELSSIGTNSIDILNFGQKIFSDIRSNGDYDAKGESEQLFLKLDNLYQELSFVSADFRSLPNSKLMLPDLSNLDKYLGYVGLFKGFAKGLPTFVGSDKKKTYLVLIQDDRELRPTGGVINSFEQFSFDQGKLISQSIFNTSDVDKELRGYINPPAELVRYLGLNNWYLKDSNWDPDFKVSAAKAEWFLEKETGDNPDGVFAVNLSTFNKLKDFSGGFFDWGKIILTGFDSKNILAFLNDDSYSSYLSALGWDGGINPQVCSGNCASIWSGVVEANLGLNKVNSQVTRSEHMIVSLVGGTVSSRLEVDFTNNSDLDYRNYMRVLAPVGSTFQSVWETNKGTTQNLSPDISTNNGLISAGVLVQIPARQSIPVVFTWSGSNTSVYEKSGKILYYFRKQPGVTGTFNMQFILPAFLTSSNVSRYNTDLTRDFTAQINW